jgi:hypothetical protein
MLRADTLLQSRFSDLVGLDEPLLRVLIAQLE